MERLVRLVAVFAVTLPVCAQTECVAGAPCYSAVTVVNAASGRSGTLDVPLNRVPAGEPK